MKAQANVILVLLMGSIVGAMAVVVMLMVVRMGAAMFLADIARVAVVEPNPGEDVDANR